MRPSAYTQGLINNNPDAASARAYLGVGTGGTFTNPAITGGNQSGTTNTSLTARYIPYANDSKVLADSSLFMGTNRIGLLTAAPEATLHIFQGESGQSAVAGSALALESTSGVAISALGANTGYLEISAGSPAAQNRGSFGYTLSAYSGSIPADTWFWRSAGNERMYLVGSGGNLTLGGTSFGTSATRTVVVFTGTPPGGAVTDGAQMYSADVGGVAGNAGMHFKDETQAVVALGTNSLFYRVRIGATGSTITNVPAATVSFNPNVVGLTSYTQVNLTITGAKDGDRVAVATPAGLNEGLFCTAKVTAADTVTIYVRNANATNVTDNTSRTFGATLVQH